jgi:hypothetical protein
MKPLVHGGAWLDPDGILDFPEDVDLIMAVDVEPTRRELRLGTHWVYCNFFEPVGTRTSNAYCLQYQKKFDLILTLDPEILTRTDKARLMLFGTTWIAPEDRKRDKTFGVSMICGGKAWMPGHKVRQEIWRRQDEITTPKRFFRSTHSTPPGHEECPRIGGSAGEKAVAFDSMFHVCVENARDLNYFSEKLIDCLVTRTVPIYWGCDNIDVFFDCRGILRAANANHAIDIANSVTEQQYNDMFPYIVENERRAQEFARPMAERVQESIMRNLFGR